MADFKDTVKTIIMRVSKGHSFSDLQKNENQSSISVFRFSILENDLENKIDKGSTVFRVRGKRKANFETNFVFHFPKKVTLAHISFGKSFLGVKSRRSTLPAVFS